MTHKGGTYRGQTAPRRTPCPACGKKGLGAWKPVITPGFPPCWVRTCRYCQQDQRRDPVGVEPSLIPPVDDDHPLRLKSE